MPRKIELDNNVVGFDKARIKKIIGHLGSIFVNNAAVGSRIDVSSRYDIKNLNGRNKFETVIESGSRFQSLIGVVHDSEQWRDPALLPYNVSITEHLGECSHSLDQIEEIANSSPDFYKDPKKIQEYYYHDKWIARTQRHYLPSYAVPVAILRAGVPALMASDYPREEMVAIEAKRLHSLKSPEMLAVGVNLSQDAISRIKDTEAIVIRERAIATFASIEAVLLAMEARNALPKKIYIQGTVASQEGIKQVGLPMSQRLFEQYGIHTYFQIGRLSYELTGGEHPFYLKNHLTGRYSVGDGGDAGDLIMLPEDRLLWPDIVTYKHVGALRKITGKPLAELNGWIGETVDLTSMVQMAELLNHHGVAETSVIGQVMTDKYLN